MDELSYTPNAFARGLAGRRTGILALHFPVSERGLNLTEFEYIFAATESARAADYHLLLWTAPIGDVEELRQLAGQGLVDGIVLMEVLSSDERVGILQESNLPFVMIGRNNDPKSFAYIDTDFEEMGRQAVAYLVELGHTSAVYVGQNPALAKAGYGPVLRGEEGLRAAGEKYGVNIRTVYSSASVKAGRELFDELAQAGDVTAILGMNEQALVGLMDAAMAAHVVIPSDLTVISLGVGAATAELTSPALTTVSVIPGELGSQAVEYLLELIGGPTDEPRQRLVAPVLTRRGSSDLRRSL